jgi:hypothetical protein
MKMFDFDQVKKLLYSRMEVVFIYLFLFRNGTKRN